jgi:type IV pilus assembly protein PilV
MTMQPRKMNRSIMHRRRTQAGAYLLEALIGILVFSFGILGIVGLQAHAIRVTNDAEMRAEAIYLANSLISQMWTDNPTPAHLKATYDSTVAGPGYVNFAALVQTRFSGGYVRPPVVMVNDPLLLVDPPSKTSSVVQVQVFWRATGEAAALEHNYTTTGVIGTN